MCSRQACYGQEWPKGLGGGVGDTAYYIWPKAKPDVQWPICKSPFGDFICLFTVYPITWGYKGCWNLVIKYSSQAQTKLQETVTVQAAWMALGTFLGTVVKK